MIKALKNAFVGKQVNNKKIIEEIHESFYTEVDSLLEYANVRFSEKEENPIEMEKRRRLIDLGFTQSEEVKKTNSEINKILHAKKENLERNELKEAISYFSQKYPQYKFITEDSVKRICNKYNLIYGPVSRYTGNVPDYNLKQIENFKIKDEDCCTIKKNRHFGIRHFATEQVELLPNKAKQYDDNYYNMCLITTYNDAPLEIAAPKSDFNTEGMELKGFKLSKIEVPDPVVLHPVYFRGNKHYLIVTAWGDEATDPEVMNEKLN